MNCEAHIKASKQPPFLSYNMDLSVIIVNWNVKNLLRQCILSLYQAQAGLKLEIIVVDSASHDGSAEMVQAEFPQVRLIASKENLGYAKGNNLGTVLAQGRYIFLLNPDTVVAPTALVTMVTYLDTQTEVGALGPQLMWPDGTIQSSRRRFPTLGSLFMESTLLGQWFPHNRYAQNYHMAAISPDHPQRVDWVVGAALLIRRDTWQQVGFIDQHFFMYFEETDWCYRCGQHGWAIHYLPHAQITHYEGKSSEQGVAARTLRFQRSKIYYTHKYFGRTWARILHLFLWLTFAWQWLEEGLKWLIGHRRELRAQRLRAYGQVLQELNYPQPPARS